ncbi:hypothetical protein GCM10011351_19820 [Paraliobacillus quinghaiensis]|uniref:DUF4349 domain-containing protein n=1 Tax=Paraliobacillus quinghaiensis TaxID=470815 RepID=A0A917TT27_9BACI|nr:DUF4349 domain-containing protein [Paraliobacillus quinghaiensis]GGM33906.1 hypothetical protein GCM10011351_19820 [Paraliobacillus quinghaiensis]
MKKVFLLIFITCISALLFACSSDDESSSENADTGSRSKANTEFEVSDEYAAEESMNTSVTSDDQDGGSKSEEVPEGSDNRKIIYNANLDVEVKNYQEAIRHIEQEINAKNGYIVSSESYNYEEDIQEGNITARIPQEHFQAFLDIVEQGDMKITHKRVSGEDVTEQYIDLESRLNSKKVVEERLLAFMENAEKTEDLLKISNDLADVQEEIERITGQLNYLENKSDFATVTMHIREKRVDLVQNEDLNTWEKTQEQLKRSFNYLLTTGSALIVFMIGNLPVLIILGVIGIFGYRYWRKKVKEDKQ